MSRSIQSVLLGTFSLRFSTGLTGGLLVYYLDDLPLFGGAHVDSTTVGLLTAGYFVAELVLSPMFGYLSDRFGAHRIMQIGPMFGLVAVLTTAFVTDLWILGGTRLLEGGAAAASIPSILGYIALATSGDQSTRGRAVARFEAATLAGIGLGIVAAGPIFDTLGRGGFILNGAIYLGSFATYRWGVAELHHEASDDERAAGTHHVRPDRLDVGRYMRILRSSHVWLLAPTWIALNAVLGSWATQSVFQLVREPPPQFHDQLLMQGFTPTSVSLGFGVVGVIFTAGLWYWGNRFRTFRRTTIIAIGLAGALVMLAAGLALNHTEGWVLAVQVALAAVAAVGLFVMAGATPAALGLLADISEAHPADRGAIMGLYSVFLGIGQILGALASGFAGDWAGIDGLLYASLILIVVAILPVHRLRASEHLVGTRPGHPGVSVARR
ncbi:MAG TPA: MFS transporter [Candidatus Limnocylindria bacterium]|nr:MFS transporter [Candidatus Limnocylindria bacterium]